MSFLVAEEVKVQFGGVRALDGFNLSIERGEIHGLIGPNGAGKTTAMNVISRLVRPTAGKVTLGDRPLPNRAEEVVSLGLARTFQAPALFDDLNAITNVAVGGYSRARAGIFRSMLRTPLAIREDREIFAKAAALMEEVGFEFPHEARVSELPFGALRKLELARSLMTDPKILLLDELTSGLSETEVAEVADLLRQLRDRTEPGVTILIVEHNVPHVFGLCDTVTAMDQGATIAVGTPTQIRNNPDVVASYLGRGAAEPAAAEGPGETPDERRIAAVSKLAPRSTAGAPSEGAVAVDDDSLLVLEQVVAGYGSTVVLKDVSMRVRTGELVGIFGRNGAGKSTLMNAIMGNPRIKSGTVSLHGHRVERWSTQRLARHGLGLVPQRGGVLVEQTVDDNLTLAVVSLRLPRREVQERYDEIMDRFPPLVTRRKQIGASLSGGERQMLAIAKVLMRKPSLLMLDEPAAGLAPSIVDELQEAVLRLNSEGLAVLVAEQNVSWVIPILERGYVLDTGTVVAAGTAAELVDSGELERSYLGGELSA